MLRVLPFIDEGMLLIQKANVLPKKSGAAYSSGCGFSVGGSVLVSRSGLSAGRYSMVAT